MVRHVEKMVLRPLAVGDVERGGENADHGVRAVAQWSFRGEEDALGTIAVDDVLFEAGQHGLRADDLAIEGLAARGMIFAEHGTHIEADCFGRADAGKRGQVGIHEQDAPLAVGRADHGRNGVDDLRQPLARIAQRFLARAL